MNLISLLGSYSGEKWMTSGSIYDLAFPFHGVTFEFRRKEVGIKMSKMLRNEEWMISYYLAPGIGWTSFLAGSHGVTCVDCSCVYSPDLKLSLVWVFPSYPTSMIILKRGLFCTWCLEVKSSGSIFSFVSWGTPMMALCFACLRPGLGKFRGWVPLNTEPRHPLLLSTSRRLGMSGWGE